MSEKQNARTIILDTAAKLFFTQGYHATGLNQIIKESKCPKGSLYYYFPNGKEELALACIDCTKELVIHKWKAKFSACEEPAEAVQAFTYELAEDAEKFNFQGFMPFSFWMAVETSLISEKLREAGQGVFSSWQAVIFDRLRETGMEDNRAREVASVIVSLLEGALILAQTNRDKQPLLTAARCIPYLINQCPCL
ncbi:TetR/AcrR family transcriptional repressor of lmrAB and yxaGH operons [Paenibacillus castaneae]|uniref:TetR/AcrR family transcriptional regulator n=1 Tax=Paenibacillus castaneae TaxID=474957 RepID=UPI000C9A0944|nr:TetR/AcrR family transcriptional regulator [Paenibacillus castaneae]NIK77208.1 TetR/AcrR family transcriptional repressor of lmrAB and yxaGH operons [Paenibacillus castaneae]